MILDPRLPEEKWIRSWCVDSPAELDLAEVFLLQQGALHFVIFRSEITVVLYEFIFGSLDPPPAEVAILPSPYLGTLTLLVVYFWF